LRPLCPLLDSCLFPMSPGARLVYYHYHYWESALVRNVGSMGRGVWTRTFYIFLRRY
jgi:hypothetical protein